MNEAQYQQKLEELYVRHPSVQKYGFGGDAYKPRLAGILEFNAFTGHPDRTYRTIHVAGTNGKGSVANMLASALAATGLTVGLYTSPHIIDFRERMRIIDAGSEGPARLIGKQEVWDFLTEWEEVMDRLGLSFFEVTTGMAFKWFADEKVDVAVIEVGLGGRLDSTNIITPEVSVIASIGLDHCGLLGDTRAAIAGEKAGIFKPGVPAVAGSRDAETAPVFEARATSVGCPLVFADEAFKDYDLIGRLTKEMDLQGEWQAENLRTVLTVLSVLGIEHSEEILRAIAHTARRMDFHGRWEMLRRDPDMLCDIGHNPPALRRNFAQLQQYLAEGRYDGLVIVYGIMADKDLDGIIPLMPPEATYIAVAPDTPRAMKVDVLYDKLKSSLSSTVLFGGSVSDGLSIAISVALNGLAVEPSAAIRQGALSRCPDPARVNAAQGPLPTLQSATSSCPDQSHKDTQGPLPILNAKKPLIYIGGSTFVVSEAIATLYYK